MSHFEGRTAVSGGLGLKVIRRADRVVPWYLMRGRRTPQVLSEVDRLATTFRKLQRSDHVVAEILALERRLELPQSDLPNHPTELVQRQYLKVLATRHIGRLCGIAVLDGRLEMTRITRAGLRVPLGVVGRKVITNNGVAFIVDAFQNLVELENMKFHALGTGSTAEAAADAALVTELTTEYNPDNTRATGSTTESAANIYRSVGTNAFDAAVLLREHGLMSQAATGGGVLFDRTVYALISLGSGESLQSTYDGTFTAGG